jgi:hypothetical protein
MDGIGELLERVCFAYGHLNGSFFLAIGDGVGELLTQ